MAKSLPYAGFGERDICRSSAAAASAAADGASRAAIIDMDLYVTEEPALAFCLVRKSMPGNRSPSLQKATRNSLFATLEHNEITSLPTGRGFCQMNIDRGSQKYKESHKNLSNRVYVVPILQATMKITTLVRRKVTRC